VGFGEHQNEKGTEYPATRLASPRPAGHANFKATGAARRLFAEPQASSFEVQPLGRGRVEGVMADAASMIIPDESFDVSECEKHFTENTSERHQADIISDENLTAFQTGPAEVCNSGRNENPPKFTHALHEKTKCFVLKEIAPGLRLRFQFDAAGGPGRATNQDRLGHHP
jgi:hypothetical protein